MSDLGQDVQDVCVYEFKLKICILSIVGIFEDSPLVSNTEQQVCQYYFN